MWPVPEFLPCGVSADQGAARGHDRGYHHLWVPRTSSTSRDQAVFADHATDASLPPNPVLIKIDRFGSGFSGAAACSER